MVVIRFLSYDGLYLKCLKGPNKSLLKLKLNAKLKVSELKIARDFRRDLNPNPSKCNFEATALTVTPTAKLKVD